MTTAEELSKRWEAAASRPIADMTFNGEFLVLGAGTRLGKVGAPADEARLGALMAAAHGRTIADSSLRHIQCGLEKKRDGDHVLALIHLALSGLAKLRDPEDARRLFLADALMSEGAHPAAIMKGLGLDLPSFGEILEKFSPDQPRVPAGNPDGGQWTHEDSAGTTNSAPRPSVGPRDRAATAEASEPPNSPKGGSSKEPKRNDLPIVDAAYQGKYHDFLRDQFTDILRKAGNTVVTEVPLTMSSDPPITAEIDILFRAVDGVVYGIEVKTGDDPSFTTAQQIVYPHVEAGGIVVSPDPRIGALGLTLGVRLTPIHLVVLRTAGPGAPIEFVPVLRYMQQ